MSQRTALEGAAALGQTVPWNLHKKADSQFTLSSSFGTLAVLVGQALHGAHSPLLMPAIRQQDYPHGTLMGPTIGTTVAGVLLSLIIVLPHALGTAKFCPERSCTPLLAALCCLSTSDHQRVYMVSWQYVCASSKPNS